MQKKKMIISHNIGQDFLKQIMEVLPEWDLFVGKDCSIWRDALVEAEIIVGWRREMEPYCLPSNSKLIWIQAWSAGVNSLPLQKLKEKNVILTSANGVHAFPISETIFALMLGLTRKIHTYTKNQQTKTWHHAGLKLELHGKTVGIIGVGSIGKETAKIAKAFGMTVLGVRRSGKQEEFVDHMYNIDQLDIILPKCDYVVVTLPLTDETYHLFGAKQFRLMKPETFFINIGRGDIVVEDTLIQALQEQTIAGAGLDVFAHEPLLKDSPLWDMENVIITPHTSGSTEHYAERVIKNILIPNLKNYLSGNFPLINTVDYSKGY